MEIGRTEKKKLFFVFRFKAGVKLKFACKKSVFCTC